MAKKGKKKGSRRSKKSAWKMAKGALYAGAVAAPMYVAYKQSGEGVEGAKKTLMAAAFMNNNGGFSFDHGKQIWAPVAAIAIVDVLSTKVGLQRRLSAAINGIIG